MGSFRPRLVDGTTVTRDELGFQTFSTQESQREASSPRSEDVRGKA